MALDKNDLEQIEHIVGKVVQKTEATLRKEMKEIVDRSAENVKTDLRKEIKGVATELRKEIRETVDRSENRVIAVLSREITDLAEINRAVIQRVDKIDELEKRIIRIETKMGIAN